MTWRTLKTHPEDLPVIITVGDRTLGFCSGTNAEESMVEVDVAEPRPGKAPELRIRDGNFVSQRLRIANGLAIGTPQRSNAVGSIYWTGSGWIDEKSNLIAGHDVEVVLEAKP